MFKIYKQALTSDEFIELYSSVGWEAPLKEQVSIALANSNFTICVKDNDKPIGMGRIIGDGALSYYIKDVAVLPEYQGKGIGKLVIQGIFDYIEQTTPKGFGVCVELISSENKEEFYEKFGFGKKPGDGMGHGMMTLVIGIK